MWWFNSDCVKYLREELGLVEDLVGTEEDSHLIALLAFEGRRLVVVQVVELQRLFGEEELAAGVAGDVRVARVDDLMGF
jgi:hypothetical protein